MFKTHVGWCLTYDHVQIGLHHEYASKGLSWIEVLIGKRDGLTSVFFFFSMHFSETCKLKMKVFALGTSCKLF